MLKVTTKSKIIFNKSKFFYTKTMIKGICFILFRWRVFLNKYNFVFGSSTNVSALLEDNYKASWSSYTDMGMLTLNQPAASPIISVAASGSVASRFLDRQRLRYHRRPVYK